MLIMLRWLLLCVAALFLVPCGPATSAQNSTSMSAPSAVQCCYQMSRLNLAGEPVHGVYAIVDLARATTEVPAIPAAAGGCDNAYPNPSLTAESWDVYGTRLQHPPTLIVNANHFLYPDPPDNPHLSRCLNATGYVYGQNTTLHPAGDTINRGPAPEALPDTLIFHRSSASAALVSIVLRPERGFAGPADMVAAVSGTMIVQNRQDTSERARSKDIEWNAPAARTAVGILPDRRHILVALVEGDRVPRRNLPGRSIGISLPELGQWMVELGAVDVLNLDGGGSSVFLYRDSPRYQFLNEVKDQFPKNSLGRQIRPTSTLLVFEDGAETRLRDVRVQGLPVFADCSLQLSAGDWVNASGSFTLQDRALLRMVAPLTVLRPETSIMMTPVGQAAGSRFQAGPADPWEPLTDEQRCSNLPAR